MRIAYVCADAGIPVFGCKGASIHVQGVVRALRRAGHTVELFAVRTEGQVPSDLLDLPVHPIRVATPASEPAAKRAAELNARLLDLIDAAGAFDLVYERYSLWSYAGVTQARRLGVPGVLEVNAPLIDEQVAHRALGDRVGAERVACRAFAAASVLIAVSDEVGAYLGSHPCAGDRVHVVPNGFDPARFAPAWTATDNGERPFTVGFLGTLKPWHGVPVLMDAFTALRERHPSARLLVIGDGPERGRLERWIDRERLGDAVELAGAVAAERVPDLLRRIDVAVAPYPELHDFYFSPLKVVEYMAAGVATVASRIGQIEALIEHGATGVLVPPGDAPALAAACAALADNPARRRVLGGAAREVAMARHTWDAVVSRILELAEPSRVMVERGDAWEVRAS